MNYQCTRQQNLQCLLTSDSTKFAEPTDPTTHYWYSRDMAWWYSASKRVLGDFQAILRDGDPTVALFEHSCTPGLHQDPQNSTVDWLTCAVHLYLGHLDGKVLHSVRGMVRSPTNDTGLPATLRLDAFLWECWTQMDPQSPEELSALKKMKRLEAQFNKRWGECVAARRRAVQELQAREPSPLVASCFFPPGPNVHSHIRGKLDQVEGETGCLVNVPIDQEPIQVIGTKEGVKRAKRLIVQMAREALTDVSENPGFTAARSQFLTAQMAIRNLGIDRFDGLPSVLDQEARAGERAGERDGEIEDDGEKGGEEMELACPAAQDQLISAQSRLLEIVGSQADGAQGDKVRQAYFEIFAWD